MTTGQLVFTSNGLVFQPSANFYGDPYVAGGSGSLPWSWAMGQQSATPLSPGGNIGDIIIYYGGEAFDGNTSDVYNYEIDYSLTPYSITFTGGGFGGYNSAQGYYSCTFSQDLLNAGYNVLDLGFTGGTGVVSGPGGSMPCQEVVTQGAPPPGGGGCFPSGSRVLMANGAWSRIEFVQPGDFVMGADGKTVRVQRVELPLLGSRRMLRMGSLRWSENHAMWTRAEDGAEWWWSAHADSWRGEVARGEIGGLKNNHSMREGVDYEFAHIDGWKEHAYEVASEYGPERV